MKPTGLTDPRLADQLRQSGAHYDLYELAEANGMTKFSDYTNEGSYMAAADLVERCKEKNVNPLSFQRELVIHSIEVEMMPDRAGTEQQKLVCYFENEKKGLVLNSGNTKVLRDMCNDDTEQAPGKKVVLYLEPTEMGASGYGLRLRPEAAPGAGDEIPF